MRGTTANLSTDFVFAKLHGAWARSVAGAVLERLVGLGSAESVGRFLAPFGIDLRQGSVQRQLLRRHLAELAAARRLLGAPLVGFYTAFMERHFFEDLKTILHARLFPGQDGDVRDLVIAAPELPALDAEALCAARDAKALVARLPAHASRPALTAVLTELEATRDVLTAECRLDQLFFGALARAVEALPAAGQAIGRDLVGGEIDVVNLMMVLRNRQTYRLPPAAMERLFLPGGRHLPVSVCVRLGHCRDAGLAVAMLPRPLRAVVQPLQDAPLALSEGALWNALWRQAHERFANLDQALGTLIAFPYLKRFEVLNLGRVFEAARLGLGAGDIREMMIGPGHV